MAGLNKRRLSDESSSEDNSSVETLVEYETSNPQKKMKKSIITPIEIKEKIEHLNNLVPTVFKKSETFLLHKVIKDLSKIQDYYEEEENNNLHYTIEAQKKNNLLKYKMTMYGAGPLNTEQTSVETYPNQSHSHYQDNFIETKLLGAGAFGKVYLAEHKITKKQYAIKKIKSHKEKEIHNAIKEVRTLAKLDHKNVIDYITAWIEPLKDSESQLSQSSESSESSYEDSSTNGINTDMKICKLESSQDSSQNESIQDFLNLKTGQKYMMFIQMSLSTMNLRTWMDNRSGPSDELIIRDIVKQTLSALDYIHNEKIVHHDINPNNILVTLKPDKIRVQIADFGLARYLLKKSCSEIGGTRLYCAPEQLQNKSDSKSDIYSFGIVLFELLYPMGTFSELIREIGVLKKGNVRPEIVNNYPGWEVILKKSIQENPEMRASARNLLNIINEKMKEKNLESMTRCCCQRLQK